MLLTGEVSAVEASIENSDVCILMLDATRGIEGQDLNIFSLIQRNPSQDKREVKA